MALEEGMTQRKYLSNFVTLRLSMQIFHSPQHKTPLPVMAHLKCFRRQEINHGSQRMVEIIRNMQRYDFLIAHPN